MKPILPSTEGQGAGPLLPSPLPHHPILAAGVVVQQAAPPTVVSDESAEQHGLTKKLFRRLCRAGLPHQLIGGMRVALRVDLEAWMRAGPHPAPTKPTDAVGAKLAASGLRPGGG